MASTGAQARRQGIAARSVGQRHGTAPGYEPEVPPDYVAPGESDVLRDEIDQRIHDINAGRVRLVSYSSAAEHLRHLDKMLRDEPVED